MMLARGVCVRCGREGPLVDGRLCPKCYSEVYGVGRVPEKLVIVQCPRCGSVRVQGKWVPPPGEGLEDIIHLMLLSAIKPTEYVEKYSVEGVEVARNPVTGTLVAKASIKVKYKGIGEEYSVEKLLEVIVKKQLCPTCFRKAAGAVQAIVQIRSWRGKLSEQEKRRVENLVMSVPGFSEAVIEVEELSEGIDIKMLDQGVAKAVASKLRALMGAKIIESHKVVGRRSDGKPKTRLTLSVRLPFFRPGLLAVYRENLVIVESIKAGKVYFRFAGSRRRHSIDIDSAWKELKTLRDVGAEIVEGFIAAVEPGWIHVQLLKPNYDYQELPRRSTIIEGQISVGKEILLVRLAGKDYIVSKDVVEPYPG